eukprot:9497095-Pyramimonas_sp.AAC.1
MHNNSQVQEVHQVPHFQSKSSQATRINRTKELLEAPLQTNILHVHIRGNLVPHFTQQGSNQSRGPSNGSVPGRGTLGGPGTNFSPSSLAIDSIQTCTFANRTLRVLGLREERDDTEHGLGGPHHVALALIEELGIDPNSGRRKQQQGTRGPVINPNGRISLAHPRRSMHIKRPKRFQILRRRQRL